MTNSTYLTIPQVARLRGLSTSRIYRLVQEGRIPVKYQDHGPMLIKEKDLAGVEWDLRSKHNAPQA